ncbi:L2 pMu [Human adenovirus 41]|uniref:L2 pMu n=3 Tax=Human mastadenovirus F TaxID=130309 RepID=A0A6B9DH06_9ADEN|nr:L2 pMu [Human adenovirus 41]QGX48368.1 L2 pMu [Human mastadenovirus F]QZA75140.1 L2 pMu protein [unidentified adenovirus]UZV41611.1 L2 pMu [Adenovirus sp.]ADN06453.1 L2 pMu [Human adenovirus 41]
MALTCRFRIPVSSYRGRSRRRRGMLGSGRRRALRRRMKGGFLPALIPIIAAAIGAIPGIASVALQARKQ